MRPTTLMYVLQILMVLIGIAFFLAAILVLMPPNSLLRWGLPIFAYLGLTCAIMAGAILILLGTVKKRGVS